MGNKQSNSHRKKPTIYSIPPNAVHPSPPGQPQIEIEDDTSVFVQWDPPQNNGGCPIIGYLVQHSEINERLWHTPNPPMTETHCWIINLNPGATYIFRAIAENIIGYSSPSQVSEPTTLTMDFTPPKFLQELESVNALQHERVEFKARLAPGPPNQITWFMDNIELFPGDEHENVEIRGNTLVLGKVEADAEIKCLVENEHGAAETFAMLTVGVPPRIREEPQAEYFFRVGEIIRLKFNYTGNPAPTIHWFHDGKPINHFQALSNTTILKISHASRNHRGEYMVKIENTHGQDSSFALVTVADKPNPPCKPTVTLMSDNSCLIEWEDGEDDGGCPVTSRTIEYFRTGWDVWLAGTTTRSKSTRIRDLIPGSKYIFRVKAENPYGQSDASESSAQLFIPDLSSGLMTTLDEMAEEEDFGKSSDDKIERQMVVETRKLLVAQNNAGSGSNSQRILTKPNDTVTVTDRSSLPEQDYPSRHINKSRFQEPGSRITYKPPALLDHYTTTRSSTLPRVSPNPTERHYGSASSLTQNLRNSPKLDQSQSQSNTDYVNDRSQSANSVSSDTRFSNTEIGRSQSSLDSARSPSMASSSSHLIFEDDSEVEGIMEADAVALPVVTSSLSFFKTTGKAAVRIRTHSSTEELGPGAANSSREVSPLPVLHVIPPTPLESSPTAASKLFSFWKDIDDVDFENINNIDDNLNNPNSEMNEDAESELRKNSGLLYPEYTSKVVSPGLTSKLLDWIWIPLLFAVFVKHLNLGVSLISIMYIFYRFYRIRQ